MPGKTYVVEHLDPELEEWSALEYINIARECSATGATFILSSVPRQLQVPARIRNEPGLQLETAAVESLFARHKDRICLLDPAASIELSTDDEQAFDIFVFGGILGDDPPRDRTSELREKGFTGRRLGPIQMTTDTAVRVTRMVVQGGSRLETINYVDYPELQLTTQESTQMPFRYVADGSGKPIMPEVVSAMLTTVSQS